MSVDKKSPKKSADQTLGARVSKAGLSMSTYYYRIRKGMTPEQALKTPTKTAATYLQRRTGERRTLAEWAVHLGISQSAMYARLRKHGPRSQRLFYTREQAEQERRRKKSHEPKKGD